MCRSIFIVEDDGDIRETLVDILKGEGYVVYSARNGKEALGMLEGIEGPSLILLDLMMPVMSGWEFLDLRGRLSRSAGDRVVVLSAVATQSLEDPTPLNTARSILKPISLSNLLSVVGEYCGPSPTARRRAS